MTHAPGRREEHQLLRSLEDAYNQFKEQASKDLASLRQQIRREAEGRRKLAEAVRRQAAEIAEVKRILEVVGSGEGPILDLDSGFDEDSDLSGIVPKPSW